MRQMHPNRNDNISFAKHNDSLCHINSSPQLWWTYENERTLFAVYIDRQHFTKNIIHCLCWCFRSMRQCSVQTRQTIVISTSSSSSSLCHGMHPPFVTKTTVFYSEKKIIKNEKHLVFVNFLLCLIVINQKKGKEKETALNGVWREKTNKRASIFFIFRCLQCHRCCTEQFQFLFAVWIRKQDIESPNCTFALL